MNCPICNKTIPWYGAASMPAEVPCFGCQADLPRVDVDKDAFCEAAFAIGQATVIRRTAVIPTREDDGIYYQRSYWHLCWRTPAERDGAWKMLRCNEHIPQDPWGNLNEEGSLWQRLRPIAVRVDTSWTGSF